MGHTETVKLLLNSGAQVNIQNKDGTSALMLASCKRHITTVQFLLDHGAAVNLQDALGHSVLMQASYDGHSQVCQLLLNHGAEVDMLTEQNDSVLMLASAMGHTETVKLLLSSGAQVNTQNKDGWSALMLASCKRHITTVQFLLDHGAAVNLQDALGHSVLMQASYDGHSQVCQLLLNHGAEVDMLTERNDSALVLASAMGHTETVKLLLNSGAQANTQNEDGWSALMLAIHHGHFNTVQCFLDHGALTCSSIEVDMPNAMLAMASCAGHTSIVKLLLDHGAADADAIIDSSLLMQATSYRSLFDAFGNLKCSVLMLASVSGHAEVVRTLLDAGADVNWHNQYGMSTLMMTCSIERAKTIAMPLLKLLFSESNFTIQGHAEIIDLLCSEGAEVNKAVNGITPLHLSAFCGNTEVARQLVNHGAQVNEKIHDCSPLSVAAMVGQTDTARYLIECGAQVKSKDIIYSIFMQNTKTTKLMSPFNSELVSRATSFLDHAMRSLARQAIDNLVPAPIACYSEMFKLLLDNHHGPVSSDTLLVASTLGLTETVRILLDHGAKVNLQKVSSGVSALMGACSGGYSELVKLLLDRGAKVDALDSKGNSALIFTCFMENPFFDEEALQKNKAEYVETIKVLLNYGAEVDIRNNKGVSAQIVACSVGNVDILRLLLSRGSQIDPKVIEIAQQQNHVEIVELLESTGGSCVLPTSNELGHQKIITEQMWKEMKDQFKEIIERQKKMLLMMETLMTKSTLAGISTDHASPGEHSGSSASSSGDEKTLKLSAVLRELLPLASEWEIIGCLLELPDGRVEEIEADKQRVRDRLRSVLKEWLKMVNPPPSWVQLADVVKQLNPEKGKAIHDKYCNHA
jgi:serine/threonine-protein phosphatase 6 regulatory ankyrin repeat subunit B